MGEILDERGEEPRSDEDRGERDDRLREHEPERGSGLLEIEAGPLEEARERELVEGLALLELLLDVLGAPARRSQHQEQIDEVGREEDPAEIPLQEVHLGRKQGEPERDRIEDQEEDQVARRVSGVHVKRHALPPDAKDERGDPDEQHDEGSEHERGAEDRAHPDLVGVGAVREEDRDDRDERFGCRRSERGEDAARGALADPQLDPQPLDPVREDLGADEDQNEGADDERRVDRVHGVFAARGPASAPRRPRRSRRGAPAACGRAG